MRSVLAACRPGDAHLGTKLDRLTRSVPDTRAIADELTAVSIKPDLGGAGYDPTDPTGRRWPPLDTEGSITDTEQCHGPRRERGWR